jgi:Na+-driven multidrug efflux pump
LITAIFQATGQKMYSFVITILRKGIVDIPLMFLLRELYLSNGVMAATPVADTIVTVLAIFLLIRFLNRYTHQNQVLGIEHP